MADNTSPGRQISKRQALETRYYLTAKREVERFVADMARLAASKTGLQTSTAFSKWEAMLERLRLKRVPDSLVNALAQSTLPDMAAGAAQIAFNTAQLEALSQREFEKLMQESLGLEGEVPGRMVTGPHSSHNWQAALEGISRTAATADFAREVMQELRQEGYPYKRWSTRADDRVRPTHVAADRQTVLLEEEFVVGGEALRFPGDPDGSLAEIMGCRCVLIGVRTGDRPWDFPEGEEPWNNPRPF